MRDRDVTALTAELDGSALARPGSSVPIVAHIGAIDAELADAAPRPESSTRMTNQPAPEDAARITGIVREHQQWSVFWDPKYRLWRAAEDDPDSDLYLESPDAATITGYITAHSRPVRHTRSP